MWKSGIINGYWWQAKVYGIGSEYGIDGGRISKLQICTGAKWDHTKAIYGYDRGLDYDGCPEDVLRMVMNEALV